MILQVTEVVFVLTANLDKKKKFEMKIYFIGFFKLKLVFYIFQSIFFLAQCMTTTFIVFFFLSNVFDFEYQSGV